MQLWPILPSPNSPVIIWFVASRPNTQCICISILFFSSSQNNNCLLYLGCFHKWLATRVAGFWLQYGLLIAYCSQYWFCSVDNTFRNWQDKIHEERWPGQLLRFPAETGRCLCWYIVKCKFVRSNLVQLPWASSVLRSDKTTGDCLIWHLRLHIFEAATADRSRINECVRAGEQVIRPG